MTTKSPDVVEMDINLGLFYEKMLQDGVLAKLVEGKMVLSFIGAAHLKAAAQWIEKHKPRNGADDPIVQKMRERQAKLRAANKNSELPPLSDEADAGSN
jgi:hypothetical protein